jgi:hypothetical protein
MPSQREVAMIFETLGHVTSVKQDYATEPLQEDRSGDPVVPRIDGGTVIVTAECQEGIVQLAVSMRERIAVGDSAHIRVDFSEPPANA